MKPCPMCQGTPFLSEPCYADEGGTMVVCGNCDAASESFILGQYGEGRSNAEASWARTPDRIERGAVCMFRDGRQGRFLSLKQVAPYKGVIEIEVNSEIISVDMYGWQMIFDIKEW